MIGSSSAPIDESAAAVALLRPLSHLLEELAGLLDRLSDAQYTRDGAAGVRGSIGGHLRHILDHVATLASAATSPNICYDDRARGTAVESSRTAASARIAELTRSLAAVGRQDRHATLQLTARLSPQGESQHMQTSLAREIAFVQSHTIHHNALIAALARVQGIELPEDFGFAPATLAYRAGQSRTD